MKIPAPILQTLAAAVLAASLASCSAEEVSPGGEDKDKKTVDYCPACGMG